MTEELRARFKKAIKNPSELRMRLTIAEGHPVLVKDIGRHMQNIGRLFSTLAKSEREPTVTLELVSLAIIEREVLIVCRSIVQENPNRCPCGREFKTPQSLGMHFKHCKGEPPILSALQESHAE